MREPFILYRRADGALDGKVFYVQFWSNEAGKYILRRSVASLLAEITGVLPPNTSPTTKPGARRIVEAWLQSHRPVSAKGQALTLLDYLATFWADEGQYAMALRARGRAISPAYLQNNRYLVINHAKPYFEAHHPGLSLSLVTPGHLEGFVMALYNSKTISPRTVNTARQSITVPLAEAYRLGLISSNPAARVAKMAEPKSERTILTMEEAKKILGGPWPDTRYYAVNLLAATTGMRLGEIRGLQLDDIKAGEIIVRHNWQDKEGLKAPKWGSSRIVPLPKQTEEVLREVAAQSPWGDGFVIYGSKKGRALSRKYIQDQFTEACTAAGIPESERRIRHLTFHTWRHYYNSVMRDKLPDYALRMLTGHKSEEMTDRYSHLTEEQRIAASALANDIFVEARKT